MEIMLTLMIVLGTTATILNLLRIAEKSPFSENGLEYINTQSKFQALLFGVALLVLFVVYFFNEANFSAFFAPGNIASPAKGVSWLGIPDGESWYSLGARLSLFITLATFTFVYLQFRKAVGGLKQLMPYLP
jgi:hypothetical protein